MDFTQLIIKQISLSSEKNVKLMGGEKVIVRTENGL